jgi:hypothetical protein
MPSPFCSALQTTLKIFIPSYPTTEGNSSMPLSADHDVCRGPNRRAIHFCGLHENDTKPLIYAVQREDGSR